MATMVDAKPRDLWWFRKNVPCLDACPVKTDAGRYVQLIAEGRFAEAYRVARDPNPIASICGRACGAPCEDACRRGKIDAPVTIRALKRFVADQFGPESLSPCTLEQVVSGSMGGGSVTPLHADQMLRRGRPRQGCAAGRRRRRRPGGARMRARSGGDGISRDGIRSDAAPGGMMRYGIPAYRLAREVIDRQAAEIEAMGVEFRYSTPLDRDLRRKRTARRWLRRDLRRRRRVARPQRPDRKLPMPTASSRPSIICSISIAAIAFRSAGKSSSWAEVWSPSTRRALPSVRWCRGCHLARG